MAHWLMKSEPGTYSWDDLVRDQSTEWDGVRNPTARLHLKAIKKGDEVFFYHSGDERAVVGIMRVTREAQPDPKDPTGCRSRSRRCGRWPAGDAEGDQGRAEPRQDGAGAAVAAVGVAGARGGVAQGARDGGRMIAALVMAAAAAHLTPDGWGAVKIGMTQAQVAKALGAKLEGEPIDDATTCLEQISGAYPDMWFMFLDRKLARISVGEKSKVTTPRGIGIGASAAKVRRKYARGLQAEPHHYLDLPGEYLTYWTVPKKRGVRFETDVKRRVETIHAGDDSIQYIEGCA